MPLPLIPVVVGFTGLFVGAAAGAKVVSGSQSSTLGPISGAVNEVSSAASTLKLALWVALIYGGYRFYKGMQ